MTEIPIVVSTNEITVGGVVDQIELQLGLGEKGDRGSRIFSGDVSPLTLPANSPFFSGYTEFKPGDVYVERSATNIAMWEWKSQPGGYTWVKTADIAVSGGGGMTSLDPDLTAIADLTGTSGLLRKSGVNTWLLDTNSYLTSNQTITLSGDVSGSGTTSIVTTVADDSHSHTGATISALDAGDVTTGTFNIARIPTGTTGTTVALGNHTHSYQPVDGDLTAIAAISGTGYLRRTGVDTWTLDTPATATWGGITGTLSSQTDLQTALNAKQDSDADLTAIAGLAGTSGLLKKTAANTWTLDTSTYLTGNQTITLSGDVSGSGTTAITVTVADDSHNHVISNVDNLQTTLDGKQPLDADLTAIAALAGTSGLLKKTATDTWALDTNTYLTGNQSITVSGDATGSGTTSIALTLANSGVSAGTYNNNAAQVRPFTVDAKGRVTSIGAAVNIAIPQSAVTNLTTDLAGKSPLAGSSSIQTVGTIYTGNWNAGPVTSRYFYQWANGEPTSNLGSPTVSEMALFDSQFNNKLWFYDPTKFTFTYTMNGTDWLTQSNSTSEIKNLVGGAGATVSNISIPNLAQKYRIDIRNDGTYVYTNALYMYFSTNSHQTKVHIWKKRDDGSWTQVTSSNTNVSSWPGHLYLPFDTIPWSTSLTGGHYNDIRIEFTPTWTTGGSYDYTNISLGNLEIWGGYPAGRRTIYNWDSDKNVTFPAALTATTTISGSGLAGSLLSSTNPLMDGAAAAGTSAIPSRQDHVHPVDTSRAPIASPTFSGTVTATTFSGSGSSLTSIPQSAVTNLVSDLSSKAPLASPALTGTPTAPTAAVDTNTTQLATTAYVINQGYLKSATASSTYLALSGGTLTGKVNTVASAAGGAGFNLPHGSAPTSPTNGDVWTTTAGMYVRVNGTTVGPFGTGAVWGSITGTLSNQTDLNNALNAKQAADNDLTAIAALAGTSGFLKKTATDTWTLDTSTYLTANQTITLSGDASGSGTTAITVTVADDSHAHTSSTISALDASDTTTGTFDIARIPTGSTGTTVSLGNHTHSYQPVDADLTAIAALAGTSGLLKKTAADTWTLDTNTYLTANQSITVSGDASGSGTTSIALTLANSGVAAGTYNNNAAQVRPFTVDAKGRVTSIGAAVNIAIAQSAVTDLVTDLAAKAPLASPTFTGTVAASGLAGSLLSSTNPLMNGSVAVGTSAIPSRQDHVHPVDTSRAPLASPTFTGTVQVSANQGLEFGSAGPRDMAGTGSPEAAVTAPPGSIWRQTNHTLGYCKWYKNTGTGNTGWLPDFEGRWVTNTPSITGFTSSTIAGRYTQSGKHVHYKVHAVVSAVTGPITISVPVNMSDPYTYGIARLYCAGNSYEGIASYNAAGTLKVEVVWNYNYPSGSGGTYTPITASLPATWVSGNIIDIDILYETA